jgi:hypothetical protein
MLHAFMLSLDKDTNVLTHYNGISSTSLMQSITLTNQGFWYENGHRPYFYQKLGLFCDLPITHCFFVIAIAIYNFCDSPLTA